MSEAFSAATIDQLAKQLREPSWVTELRRRALSRYTELPWPHKSDEIWRRTDVSLLDPMQDFSAAAQSLQESIKLSEEQFASFANPLGDEQLLVRANGAWLTDGASHGIVVQGLSKAYDQWHLPIREAIETDGLSEAEEKLASLALAFHDDALIVNIPAHKTYEQPVRLVHLFSAAAHQAIFPMTIINVGTGSSVTFIDEYVSIEPGGIDAAHLAHGRIELIVEPQANVRYIRLQRWAAHSREFLLQRVSLSQSAAITLANINLGASLSKTHIITRLMGEHSSSKIYGFVFGKNNQHIDQHTLQDHQSAHTTSDLQFKAALQDQSRMVYTGLIRIAKSSNQSQAYQSNHNLILSEGAKADTIPMLEILADDVQCKHGASVSPIDEDQTFYLMSRGIPRERAQRLIVMGFVESIIQQVPFEPLQQRLRQEIEGSLHSG